MRSTPIRAASVEAPFTRRAVFEELESRLLMSADLNPLAHETLLAAPALQGAEFRALVDDSSAVTSTAVTAVQRTHEIVFVDPRVPDREPLLAGLTAQSDGRSFEVIELDPRRDGIAQITESLHGRMQIDAVHFITHGTDGAIQLGSTWLDAKTLAANTGAVAGWGDSLKQDADLLFYGCDLASSASGRALMGWIAELTSGDVAASVDATGAAQDGGDWDLEAKFGAIETEVAVGADARAGWSHVLGGVPAGIETPANITPNSNLQETPAVATAPDGRFVVAWTSNSQDGNGLGVYARLYDAAGNPQSGEILVNQTTIGDQSRATVAIDAAGKFVVAWSGNGAGGDGADVFFRRFSATGLALGGEILVNNLAIPNNQSKPDVAIETNGDFAVVWQSFEAGTGTTEIWMRRFLADGTAAGGNTLVSTSGGDDDVDPSIAMDDDGDFVVAWESEDANNSGVFARRYDNAGVAQGGIISVNSTTQGEQQRPDVAMDAVGNFVVVWDGEGAIDDKGIFGRRFAATGADPAAGVIGEFRLSTLTGPDQTAASVSMSGAGRFVVTWESEDQDTDNLGIYAKEYAPTGIPDGGEFRVNTTVTGDQELPAVAMDDAGGYVAAWSGQGSGDGNGVFWLRYAPAATGTISGTVFHDVDGDADITESGTLSFAGATVRLFRDDGDGAMDPGDLLVGSTLTDAAGAYSFSGLSNSTYYVVVDSRSIGAATNVWAEQTYGVAGSALGAGFTLVDGALFGGRDPNSSDNSTDLPASLVTSEHATKVALSGTGVGGVDFGFSFNAVTSARDGDDDAGSVDRSVQGSLRQFIQNANATAGTQAADFSIGGGGPQTINVAAALPAITDRIVLDGATQGGFAGSPLITLNGASASGAIGLTLGTGSDGSGIRGLSVTRFTYGISIDSRDNVIGGTTAVARNVVSLNNLDGIRINNPNATGNQIVGNYIGLAADGLTSATNSGAGVSVSGTGNTIGGTASGAGNVISANGTGVLLSAAGNFVQGNRIGTDAGGTLDRGNLTDGVRISGAGNNTIGGTVPAARNVISGNNSDGIEITGTGATGNVVLGNFIGTDAAGGADVGNTEDGVRLTSGAANNTIGGTAPGAGNVISGSGVSSTASDGIDIGAGSSGTVIQGNLIGTDATGSVAIANRGTGIRVASGANVIGGTAPEARNVISGNRVDGIAILGSSGNRIQGNYIGTDRTGMTAIGNGEDGIWLNSASGNTVGGTALGAGNVISANGIDGIMVDASSGNTIHGNFIGTNALGTGDLGNTEVGIWLSNAANNTIGGAAPGARNVISGNAWSGIDATGTSTGNIIRGNYIGTDETGTVALGNDAWGIRLAADSNLVGGTGADDGNLISGNGIDGILVDASSGNVLQGNYIGTDRTGTAAIGNAEDGIWLDNASDTTIGGTVSGAGNLISGNLWSGIALLNGGVDNVIQGNRIGVDAAGSGPLANGRWGVDIGGAADTMVGGLAAGAANVIAYNAWDGVSVTAGTGHTISGNSIYSNGQIGIDIGLDDATPNDPLDSDGGANNGQNHPVLIAASTTSVSGTLNGAPSTTFRIELFASPTADGEGQRYFGSISGTTDASGAWSFTAPVAVSLGEWVTATATDGATGDTSEFSAALQVNSAPVNSVPLGPLTANEDAPLALGAISVSDAENNVNSVALTVLNGTLAATGAGTATVLGSGGANVTIAGTQGDINATLAGLVYQGNPNYNGSDTLTLTSTDAQGLQDVDAIAIAVNPVNDAPAALGESYNVTEDFALSVPFGAGVLANDTDVDSAPLAAVLDAGPANGSITLNPDGSFTYIPNANFNGVDTFTYRAFDGSLSSATTTVTIAVGPVDDLPAATGDAFVATEDTPLAIAAPGVLANDTGLGDGALTLAVTTGPANGAVVLNGDGSFTYTPAANFSGADAFIYQVRDADGDISTATVSITVDPADDFPVASSDSYVTSEDTPLAIAAPGVLANDTGLWDGGITLSVVSVSGGTASLSNDGSFLFTPVANFSGLASFTYEVRDADGDASTATVGISVTPVNDAPVANDVVANGSEDDPQIAVTLTGSDVDGSIASFRLASLPGNGTLYTDAGLTSAAAVGVDYPVAGTPLTLYFAPTANWNGSTTFQFTATDAGGLSDATPATATINVAPVNDTPAAVADVAATNENTAVTTGDVLVNDALGDQPTTIVAFDAASAQGGAVVLGAGNTFTYMPAATFSGIDTFTYTIRDGDGETSTATVTMTVANVANDPPVNIVPGGQIIAEDVALVFSTGNGNRIAVADPDAGANPLQVTLTATNGTLTLVGTAGLVFLAGDGTADAAITVTGTQAAINAALDGMSFVPTLNYTGAATLAITTDDLGASGTGGAKSDSDVVSITVNSIDDAPVLNVTGTPAFTEGGAAVPLAPSATLTDADSANLASLTVTITNLLDGAAESLSANTTGTLITATYNAGSGALTLNGADTVANYQQVLRTVRYNNTSDAPTATPRVITFVANDGGSPSNVAATTVMVNAVNDAPTATLTAAGYAATENMTLNLHGTGMSVADIDALATSVVTVYLDATSGLLSATAGTTGVTIAGTGSPSLTLTGTLAQVNALLAGGGGGTVTYLVGSDSPFPTDTLTLSISDNGATGAGGALWASESRTVNLTAVNDAPLITIPGTATMSEDATLVFSAAGGNQISITDVDAGGAPVAVSLNVSNGLISLAGIAGLTFTVGDGAADASMTFTGTVAAINAALNGLAFAPTANFNGSAFLSVSVNDQGNSGSGGPLLAANFCAITVSAVNDLPAGTDNTLVLPQDLPRALVVADFGFTDPDTGDALSGVRIDTLSLPPGATLRLGAANVTAGQVIDVADINAGNLVFTPALGTSGAPYASFAFSLRDGAGGFDAAPNTMTLNVASAANNAPAGTNNTVTTFDSTNRVFTVTDFGFNDPDAGDALSAVRIDTLPSALLGTLLLGVLPVLPGQIVLVGDITAGNLLFVPLPLLTGTTSFTFSVLDTNGPAFDVTPNTMTVSVIPMSNAPVNAVPGLPTATEDAATAIVGIAVNDPNGDLASVQLTVVSGALSATAAGAVAVAGSGTASLTITGTQADINATLASLGYQGNPDFAGVDTLTITSTDATALQDFDSFALTVGAANDAPVAVVPPSYAATEQVALALAGTGLAVADVDSGAASVTVTLSAITGALFVGGGAGVAVSGSGTPLVTLTGRVTDINALLTGGSINYLVTSDSPPPTDTLTLTIDDGGATGAGGPRIASAASMITIGASNDAPVNTLPGGATTLEDAAVVYSAGLGNQISITDTDARGAPVQVSVAGSNGVITLGGVAGLTFTAGDGTADASMTFTGTVASINAALDGLVFTPDPNYNGLAFIQLNSNDLGASGAGGPRSDTDLATIDVLPVNDAPAGSDTTVTLNEDSSYTFTIADFGFNDVDFGDTMTEVRIDSVTLPAGATLRLAGAPVIAGMVIAAADINAGNLIFTPVTDANGAGYANFTFSVRDTGVPPGPLFDPAPNTMTIDVAPVNDLPVITSDGGLATATLTAVENTTGVTTVTATDIDLQLLTFSIAGGADAAWFFINATTGALTFNSAPNFEAPADAGANNVYDVVVRVEDGAGGSDTQALAITVSDANDAPFVVGDAYSTVEDTPLSLAAPGAVANDGDEDLNPITATLLSGPTNGAVAFNTDGSFVYTPNANFAGVDSFTYHVSDGALVSADATITISVSPVNDAPTAADGNVLSTPAVAYTFTLADFNYTDVDGDPLDHVQITALPTLGSLTLGGVAVALNQVVTAADIAAGNLQYVAPMGTVAADSFGFRAHDGTVYAAAGSTMTVGFIVPPAPPPAPASVAGPPPAPPTPPAPAPAPEPGGGPGAGAGTPPPATGGSHGGGGGDGGGAAGTAAAPTFAENAPATAESIAAPAAAAVTAAPIAALTGPSGGVSSSSGGLQTDTRSLGSVESIQARGELAEAEVKAAMQEIAVMRDQEFRQELNKLREEVQQEAVVETRVAASVFAVSTGLSVGYVLWLLRGGVLLASLLSSIPAWRLLDPLPVLGRVGGQSDEDDESLEDMVDNRPDRDEAGTDEETPAPRGAMRMLQAFRRSAT